MSPIKQLEVLKNPTINSLEMMGVNKKQWNKKQAKINSIQKQSSVFV